MAKILKILFSTHNCTFFASLFAENSVTRDEVLRVDCFALDDSIIALFKGNKD
jgi:hypothetical protein